MRAIPSSRGHHIPWLVVPFPYLHSQKWASQVLTLISLILTAAGNILPFEEFVRLDLAYLDNQVNLSTYLKVHNLNDIVKPFLPFKVTYLHILGMR